MIQIPLLFWLAVLTAVLAVSVVYITEKKLNKKKKK